MTNIISVLSTVQAWMASALISQGHYHDHLLAPHPGSCSAELPGRCHRDRHCYSQMGDEKPAMGLPQRRRRAGGVPCPRPAVEAAQAALGVRLPQGDSQTLASTNSFLFLFLALLCFPCPQGWQLTQSDSVYLATGPLMTSASPRSHPGFNQRGQELLGMQGSSLQPLGP